MSYQELNQFNSPNFTRGADANSVWGLGARVVKSITIHWWGDPANKPTFENTINYLCRTGGNTSAHVIAEAGRVAWIVNGFDCAWHAGNAYGNTTSIGIECNPRASDGDYQTIGELVRDIRAIYGDIPLVPHRDWQSTQCPGNYDLARIDRIARGQSSNPTPAPTPAPKPNPTPSGQIIRSTDELNWLVESGDTLSKICNYYYGPSDGPKMVNKVAAYNNIDANSLRVGQRVWLVGPIVWNIEAPDTVSSICNYYGISWQWLAARNPSQVNGPNTELYIGNSLRIL